MRRRNPPGPPTPRSPAAGAIVGTFVVGDGTLVGQQPQVNKAKLTLNGKAFVTNIFTDWHAVQPGKPSLTLKAGAFTAVSSSTVVVGKPTLVLNAEAVLTIIPVYAHMAKAQLLLLGKPFALLTNSIVSVGKPALILQGKSFRAKQVVLLPSVPIEIDLIPSVPGSLNLVPTTEENRDLVPTVEVFR